MIVFELALIALLAFGVVSLAAGPTPATAGAPAARADHPFRSFAGARTCIAWVGTLTDGGPCGRTPDEHQA